MPRRRVYESDEDENENEYVSVPVRYGASTKRKKTKWLRGLLSFYKSQKRVNPAYSYSQAMKDYRTIYYR